MRILNYFKVLPKPLKGFRKRPKLLKLNTVKTAWDHADLQLWWSRDSTDLAPSTFSFWYKSSAAFPGTVRTVVSSLLDCYCLVLSFAQLLAWLTEDF